MQVIEKPACRGVYPVTYQQTVAKKVTGVYAWDTGGRSKREFTGHNKGTHLLVREEFEIQIRPDITRCHAARRDRTNVEFSYFHQARLSVCICDCKPAKVFSVLLITGADIHIRADITQCQQHDIQNASVHWWPLRLQKTVRCSVTSFFQTTGSKIHFSHLSDGPSLDYSLNCQSSFSGSHWRNIRFSWCIKVHSLLDRLWSVVPALAKRRNKKDLFFFCWILRLSMCHFSTLTLFRTSAGGVFVVLCLNDSGIFSPK